MPTAGLKMVATRVAINLAVTAYCSRFDSGGVEHVPLGFDIYPSSVGMQLEALSKVGVLQELGVLVLSAFMDAR